MAVLKKRTSKTPTKSSKSRKKATSTTRRSSGLKTKVGILESALETNESDVLNDLIEKSKRKLTENSVTQALLRIKTKVDSKVNTENRTQFYIFTALLVTSILLLVFRK